MHGSEQRRVREAAELIADGGVDLRDAVAQQVAPQGRGRVEVAAAAIVDEAMAFRAHDDEGLGRRAPGHPGERMPDAR
jgi:hypothetical protein